MEREEFLSKLGISALTICMGSCLSSCGKSGDPAPTEEKPPTTSNPPPTNPPPTNPPPTNPPPTNPPPTNPPPTNPPPTNPPPTNPPPTTPPGAIFTVDLGTALTSVGSSIVSNGVIVARVATGDAVASFVAVQVACTHEGASIGYNGSQGLFVCPLHGSIFSKSGAVVQGPANTSLKQYSISITGTTLAVSA